jgi:hypothetical protein
VPGPEGGFVRIRTRSTLVAAMDPVSIVTAVGSAISAVVQVSERLCVFIKDTKDVGNAIKSIAVELESLRDVLEAMKYTLEGPTLKAAENALHAHESRGLWRSVKASISLCQTSVDKLRNALEAVKPEASGFVGQAVRRFKLNLRDGEIQACRAEFRNHCDVISMALLMINVYAPRSVDRKSCRELTWGQAGHFSYPWRSYRRSGPQDRAPDRHDCTTRPLE